MRQKVHGRKKIGESQRGSSVRCVDIGVGSNVRGVGEGFVLWSVWEFIKRNVSPGMGLKNVHRRRGHMILQE